ncbi:hypothetical protein CR513_62696, partial [Mucuna pruriens]
MIILADQTGCGSVRVCFRTLKPSSLSSLSVFSFSLSLAVSHELRAFILPRKIRRVKDKLSVFREAERLKMGGDDSGEQNDNFDWNTEDELEIENFQSSSSCLTVPNGDAVTGSGELLMSYSLPLKASSSAVSANSKVLDHFIGMGFSREMVSK